MKKMKDILKRKVSVGLVAVMLVSQTPATAFAEETVKQETAAEPVSTQEMTAASEAPQQTKNETAAEGEIAPEQPEDKTGDETPVEAAVPIEPSTLAEAADNGSEDEAEKQETPESDKKEAASDGDKEKEEDKAAEEKKTPAFKESRSVDGVRVTVEAEEGVFPEGAAALSIEKVSAAQERKAEEAVEDKRPEEQNVAVSYTYDIKVLDKDGNEIQPADESKVKVSFTLEEVADANLTTNVYHIVEEDSQNGGDSGEAAPKEGDDLKNSSNEEADAGNSAELTAEKLEVETDGDTAIVETDGFSLYTVEFTYKTKQYVLPGDSEVALSDILEAVGLSGEASAVEVSKSSLFSAEKNEGGEWIVTAHKAFSTKEWMKVTIGGVKYEITVTDDQEVGSWAELQAQFDSASTEENNPTLITLSGDVTAGEGDSALVIQTDKYVTLDLAGHTIDRGLAGEDKNPAENGSVITVSGNLTLTDGSETQTGTITGGNTTGNGGGVYVDEGGKFTMEGGTISGCEATNGGGVYVNSGMFNSGTFIMNGGSITNCSANSEGGGVNVNGGTFTMTDGTISGCSATGGYNSNSYGGGVCVNGGTFTMENGTISGCEATNGGGVYFNYGTFTMENGTINGCNVNGYGGGVYINYGTFTMENSTISGCSASFSGGVYVNGGEFTMNDGTISGCSATNENSIGGGVYVDGGGKFTMNGGTISDCSASYGGGVYVEVSSFQVSGSPVIKGNKTGENANNVELDSGTTITVTGALIPGAEIYVNAGKGVVATGENYTLQASDADAFHSDRDGSLAAALDSDGKVKFFTPWGALQVKFNNASTVAGSPTRITLTGSVTAGEGDTALVIPAGKYVTLDLSGNTIDRGLVGKDPAENGSVIRVEGNLTLSDNSTGHTGKITGGNSTRSGGGVIVSGTFTMNGGTISGCSVTGGDEFVGGGGVIVSGTFTMNGGSITGCKVKVDGDFFWYGGGVFVDEGSTFTMSGGTIDSCRAKGNGGGVYVGGGTFTMEGGTITNCRAEKDGGVSVSYGTFTMEGGTITNCSTNITDGIDGVSVYGGTFTMSGGTIESCRKGGVYVGDSTFTMEGGTITNCSARNGGGVYVGWNCEFTMSGGTISGCSAEYNGGGVYVISGGTFTMEKGTITGCSAGYDGGGVYVDDGTFNMSGAPVIRDNKKGDVVNNVVLKSGKTITVTGELTTGAEIWVNAGKDVAFATKGDSYSITDTDLAKFHSDTVSSLVAAEDSDGSVKFFTPWGALRAKFNNASTVAGSPTRITLTGDVTADEGDSALLIPAGRYVTLDLSGNTIDRGLANKSAKDNGNVITVNGNLTLTDSSSDKTGKLTGGKNNGNGGGVSVEGGKFTMSDGTISGCNANGYGGGGVFVNKGGTFTMNGGTITGCTVADHYDTYGGGVCNYGTFAMSGGTITNCSAKKGGGVYVQGDGSVEGGKLTMNGGTINGCNATSDGGGVYVGGGNGKFTMTDGTITDCNAIVLGGGVYVEGGNKFTMENGTITGCKANNSGGGVYVHGNSFTMDGGTITGCSATNGGGVYVLKDMFTMSGGTISGCTATNHGGGVYVAGYEDIRGTFNMSGGTITGCSATNGGGVFAGMLCTFTMSGAPVIRDNKKDGNANNVVLDGGKTISVNGALTSGAEIHVNAGKGDVVATGENYTLQASDADAFRSDRPSSLTAALDNDGKVKFFNPWGALQLKFNNASTVAGSPTQITLSGNVTADEGDSALVIPEDRYVTLDLNGHTIDRGLAGQGVDNNGNVITVSGNLTLTDSSAAHTGKITGGNNGQVSGGGVSVNGGTFTMSGGTISGCNAALGGGVNVDSGTFTMTGGTITGCNAYNSGGGVCVNGSFTMNGGTFTMTGGTITDCNATSYGGRGGGVYVEGGGKFTMEGGTIDRCNTAAAGGGVYNHGTFNMSDGTITNCSVTGDESNGGGVYIEDRGTFKVSGTPVISGNMKGSTSANNVELGGKTISVNGALTSGAEIHVNAGLGVPIAEKGGDRTTALTETEAGYFKCDQDPQYKAGLNENGQVVFKTALPAIANATGLTYNGTEQEPGLTFDGVSLTAGTDYTVSYKKVVEGTETSIIGAPKDAGTYKAVATGKGRYEGTSEAVFTIAPKTVTVSSGISANDKTYDGTAAAALDTTGAVFDEIYEGDSLTVSGNGAFADASAGTNKTVTIDQSSLTLGGTSSGNYVLASGVNQTQTTATINKKKITITGVTVADKEYDGNTTATTNITNAVVTGLVGSDNVEFTVSGAFADANKGENKPVTLSNWTFTNGGENYEIDAANSQKEAFANITGTQVYITGIHAVNKEYDGNKTATVSGTAVLKKVNGGDVVSDLSVSNITAEFADKNVGNDKTVSINGGTLSDSENYTLVPGATTGLTANITPKPVTITRLSAENKVYDTTAAATVTDTAVIEGKLENDDVTVSAGTAAFDNADAGEGKTVTFTGFSLTGADASNYELSGQPAEVSANITPAPITDAAVTLSDTQLTYNGSEQTVSVVSVKLGGRDLSGTSDYEVTAGTRGTDVNVYTVTVTGKGNYQGSATAEWQITPKDMTVSAENVSVPYDGQPHGITVSVTDPVNGATILYGTAEGSCTLEYSPTITNVSESPKTVYYQVSADNYKPYTGSATITVVKADIEASEITAPAAESAVYTGSAHALANAGSVAGGIGTMYYALGDSTGNAPADGLFTISVPKAIKAGTYSVWYKVKGDGNHKDTSPQCIQVSIDRADILPVVTITGWTYLDAAHTPAVTEGNPGKGAVSFVYYTDAECSKKTTPGNSGAAAEGAVPKNAGTWYVKALVAETENYKAGTATASFTIAKRSLAGATITLTENDGNNEYGDPTDGILLYNGNNQTVSVTGVEFGGTVIPDSEYTVYVPVGKNADTYQVSVKAKENTNYTGEARTAFAILKGKLRFEENELPRTGNVIKYGQMLSAAVLNSANATIVGPNGQDAGTLSGGWHWVDSNTVPAVSDSGRTKYKVYFGPNNSYENGTDLNYVRVEKELTVTVTKSTPAAPEGLFWTKSSAGTADGAIYGVDRTMEYSVDDRFTWKAVTGTAITGLRAGEVYIRFAETENTNAGREATITIGGTSSPLTGVSISGIGDSGYPKYGQTLRADLTPAGCGNVAFAWLRDGEVIGGATGRSYTLTAEDIGKTIQVRAVQQSGTDTPVSFTSDATNAVQKAEVSTAPPVPELIEKTATSVKVKPMEGCEFAYCDNSSSEYHDVNGVEITGLSPDTKYRIHARYKDTETTDFYAYSDPLYVRTKPVNSGSSTGSQTTTTTITSLEKVGTQGGALETTVTVEGGTSDYKPQITGADLNALTEQLKNLLQSNDLQGSMILTEAEKAAVMDGATLTLDMGIKKLEDNENGANAVPAEDRTAAETKAVEVAGQIAGSNAQPGDACLFLDITLHKQIDGVDVGTVPEPGADITFDITAPESMTKNIPANKTRWYFVLCIHNWKAVEVGRSNTPDIHVSSRLFSTYVLTYVDKENSSGGGSGGGGGGTPTPSYTPVITQPEHGIITVNPESPQSGQDAVITVTPEDGYETENVTVKDKDSNTVPVTKNDDGTYTFTQPSTGSVTIEAVIRQATDLTPVIKKPEHGTISVNPAKPKAGEPAIITVTPDEGYEVDSVIVTDKDGKPVAFTLHEDGTYSFVQPASGCVTIEAVLRLKNGVIVRFDLNGKTGTEPDPQTFIKGGKAVRPNDPAAEGYTFTGWYMDEKCKNAYDFDTPVNEDIILYAGWEKKEGPGPDDDDFGIYFAELFDDPYEGVHYNADYNDGEGRYEIVYTGAPIKPLIRVTSKADGVLKEGIDYSVSYSNNKNYSKKKPATIKVSGKGFYKSKKVLELHILQADLEEAQTRGLIAGADELKTLSGKKLNPVIVYRGYKLKSGDLNLSNKDKITADTITDITGKGNFTGTLKDVEVKVIGKDDQKKGAIKVNLKAGQHVYNGEAHELSITTADTAGELTVTAGSSKAPLEEGTDFVVSYSGNTDAGKAAVAITGIGEYNGTVVKNFTIEADKTTDITAELAEPDESVYFNVRGAKPDITVTAHRKAEDETVSDEVLTEGKDYNVRYSSNMKIGDGAYTVKFLGNYKGHKDANGSFKIVQAPIDEAKVEAVQMIYKKPGKYLPKPFVSIDGVQLKNSDYTYKYYIDDEEITSKYKLSLADDEISKTVKIVVTGKGNYTNSTAEGTYEVVRRTADAIDLTKAKIVAKDKVNGKDVKIGKQEYNGTPIEPEIRVMARINKKWVEVDPSLYTVSYINNLNKGSATILVTGDGEETIGSKTVKFSISTMSFELFKLIFGE